jgi:NAD(P)-dependent dehydrogenase (short-subunit alcohol dehydrogenase family)
VSERPGAPVALVVGGSAGIGRATALALAARGVRLAILARGRQGVAGMVRKLHAGGSEALGLLVDATDEERVEQAVAGVCEHYGRLDLLVHCVGAYPALPLSECTLEQWESVLRTNLTSAFLCARAAVPRMRAGGGGVIVLTGSAHVLRPRARPDREAYYASKGGIVGLASALRASYEPEGVRTVVVHPGWTVDTDAPEHPELQLSATQVGEAIAAAVAVPAEVAVRELVLVARDA